MKNAVKTPKLHGRWYEAHSVIGVLILIPLFVIVFTGTISFFRNELLVWHIPELRFEVPEAVESVDPLIAPHLNEVPQDANFLQIRLPNEYTPALTLRWFMEGEDKEHALHWNPNTGEALDANALSSHLAMKLYHWHYLRPLPQGLRISGLIALVWFALTVSGIYIHRKKLISQFKGWGNGGVKAFQSWMHTVAGTLTLPLHVVYGATGALFGLNTIALPLVIILAYGGDQDKAMTELLGREPEPAYTEVMVEALPAFDPILKSALTHAPEGATVLDLSMSKPFDEAAELHAHFIDASGNRGEVVFDLHKSAEPKAVVTADQSPGALQVFMVAFKLHFGHIGGYFGRTIFFMGGVALILLTYAGARLWCIRKQRELPRATMITEKLFDGFALGLMPAVGIFVWANRLLPAGVAERGNVEVWIFHGSWALIGISVFVFGTAPVTRRWMWRSTVLLLGLIPVLDGVLHGTWPWSASSWIAPTFGAVNVALLSFAGAWAAYELRSAKRTKVAQSSTLCSENS